MSLIVPRSIVVLMHRWGIYLTVGPHNWSNQFNYITCNAVRDKCPPLGPIFVTFMQFFLEKFRHITRSDHFVGCPIIYTDTIHNDILFINTSTMLDTAKLIL